MNFKKGNKVKLLRLPDWLLHDLPIEEQIELRQALGQILKITDVDNHGYIWLDISIRQESGSDAMCSGHSFCVTDDCVEHTDSN